MGKGWERMLSGRFRFAWFAFPVPCRIITDFKDVKAYDLLQSHANFVLRSCGADVVHHHFGVGSAACALGLPPVPGSATPPQQSTLETGLHFEAAVLAQLRKAQRSDEATRPEMI